MDRFLAPTSPEAIAHDHLTYAEIFICPSDWVANASCSENWVSWDIEHPAIDETLIAGCAAYKAFDRFLSGKDLFILPRTRNELANVLYVNQFIAVGGSSSDKFFLTSAGKDMPKIQSTTPSPGRVMPSSQEDIPG